MSYAEDLERRCEEKLLEAIVESSAGNCYYKDGAWYRYLDDIMCVPPKSGSIQIWQGCPKHGYIEIYKGRVERVRHLLGEMFERYL